MRVPCSLESESRTVDGIVTYLSRTGAHVYVPAETLDDDNLRDGMRMVVRLHGSENNGLAALSARLRRVSPERQSGAVRGMRRVILELVNDSEVVGQKLQNLLPTNRYAVVVLNGHWDLKSKVIQSLQNDYRVIECDTTETALETLEREAVAVVIGDELLLRKDGPALLKRISRHSPTQQALAILIKAASDPHRFRIILGLGDMVRHLPEPICEHELRTLVGHAIHMKAVEAKSLRLSADVERSCASFDREETLRHQLKDVGTDKAFGGLKGSSKAFQTVLAELSMVRASDVTVHLAGETGTGKEVVSRALHKSGPRSKKPIIVVNCAGMTETLSQSTLFGHKKGAFTGAYTTRTGAFQEAAGGTLMLDEVGDLPPLTQGMLLRVLQSGEVVPVGATRPTRVDVRVISTSNRCLRSEVREGRFREDLYYRLCGITISLPPLRERVGDIPILAQHFLERFASKHNKEISQFSPAAMTALECHDWPGNVRELEHEIERAVVLYDRNNGGSRVELDLISQRVAENQAKSWRSEEALTDSGIFIPYHLAFDDAVEMLKKAFLLKALEETDWILARAAKLLRMNRSRLSKVLTRLGWSRSSSLPASQ